MAPEDLQFLQALLQGRSGFVLQADRAYLVESRLGSLARREGYPSVSALLVALRQQPGGTLAWAAIEAMSSTDTHFFRDRTPFAQLQAEILPAFAKARPGGAVRVLSAGCATGQEPYSIAMAAREAGLDGVEICGADLSERCLEKARAGLYTQFEVQRGLPVRRLLRWFDKVEDMWRIKPELRGVVRWGRVNLLDDLSAMAGFDVIFCRYVLKDFAPERRARVLEALAAILAEDGVLCLGASETASEAGEAFRAVAGRRGMYVKTTHAARRAA
ncbi:MAG TPA: protein-glutamate O-methyltransferase CheR [Caulobacteraceae bacterium]